MSAINLISTFLRRGWTRIAFIGVSKHAGKTTAMNSAVAEAQILGVTLGLCSIGLDGERLDTVMGIEKPPVRVFPGMLAASSEKALLQSNTQLEYLLDTEISSPLGNVMITRTLVPGNLLLAGVRQRHHLKKLLPRMEGLGAKMIFVDGAFNRIAAAAPDIVDAAVLTAGAVSGKTVSDVAVAAQPILERFRLPLLEPNLRNIFQPAVDTGETAAWDGSALLRFARHQAILGLGQDTRWSGDFTHLFLPGVVSDSVLESLLFHPCSLTVIALHPAQIVADSTMLKKWFHKGHSIVLWKSLPIAAIAVNPHSVLSSDFSGVELVQEFSRRFPGIPVYNALSAVNGRNRQ